MDTDKLFELAAPFLEKNDFGMAHTARVFTIAKENFLIEKEIEDLTFASIILHDIGGSTIREQYEKGPTIASELLKKLACPTSLVKHVRQIVGTHHDHPDNPSESFRILYDSDKIVMFSKEEYPYYNARAGFDWAKIIALIYSKKGRRLAQKMLKQRRKEQWPIQKCFRACMLAKV